MDETIGYLQIFCNCESPWPYEKTFKVVTSTSIDIEPVQNEWVEMYCKKCEEEIYNYNVKPQRN